MNTPIVDFLRKYDNEDILRLHMPGHKGLIDIPTGYDITEISGADFLFSPGGIIKESEKNASALYETAMTLYSTEGSSLCIKTMIAMLKKIGVNKILSPRNSHISFVNACALLETEVCWLYPKSEVSDISSGEYTAEDIDEALLKTGCKAVYITSPDYLGNILDIEAISKVCKSNGAYLIVDNAHGAYLKFLKRDTHPITLGADMCCDSAHKTLPVLTGGAYLHISKNADKRFLNISKSVMSVFATTSPSYLIMASLDMANKFLSEKENIYSAEERFIEFKKEISLLGFYDISKEPFKITIDTYLSSITSEALVKSLEENKISVEYSDRSAVVLMLSAYNSEADLLRLKEAFCYAAKLKCGLSVEKMVFKLMPAQVKMSITEAFFSDDEEIPTEFSVGRICSATKVICPPCIPIVVSGEVFDKNSVKILKRYGISTVNVVK